MIIGRDVFVWLIPYKYHIKALMSSKRLNGPVSFGGTDKKLMRNYAIR